MESTDGQLNAEEALTSSVGVGGLFSGRLWFVSRRPTVLGLRAERLGYSLGQVPKLLLGHQGFEKFDFSEANRDGRAAIPPT
jgi:hypothetical protein